MPQGTFVPPHCSSLCPTKGIILYLNTFHTIIGCFHQTYFHSKVNNRFIVFSQAPSLGLHAPKRLYLTLFFTGNVLILKVSYALKCEIVASWREKSKLWGFFSLFSFLSFKESKPFGYPKQRRLFIQRAKEKHQWNRRKHKIPLHLLLNLPQDFMQTLFGADTTNLFNLLSDS